MSDVVVTVPMNLWEDWIEEGDLPGDLKSLLEPGESWGFYTWGTRPEIERGERVYVVAHRQLRGYAPLVRLHYEERPGRGQGPVCFDRHGGAVAVSIDEPIRGFRGWRYRWWDRSAERPFPGWRTP